MAGNTMSSYQSDVATRGYCGKLTGIYNSTTSLPISALSDDGTTASADANVGIYVRDYDAGDVATLQIDGVCDFAIAGGVIAPGTLCTTSAAGKVVAGASGDRAFLKMLSGKSSSGATADGAECRVLILPTPIDIA